MLCIRKLIMYVTVPVPQVCLAASTSEIQVYGVKALQDGDGFTNAQCRFLTYLHEAVR